MTSQTQSWLPGAEQTTTEQHRFLAFIARLCLVLLFPFSCVNKIFDYFWSFPFNGDAWNENFWPFLKNFGLAGGFLYIAADAKMQSLRGAFSFSPREAQK